MGFYKIMWKKSAEKDLYRIDPIHIPRIIEHIKGLAYNPFPSGCRKIVGTKYIYRIRVGDYRVIYHVDTKDLIITVIYIRHRRDAYRHR